MPSTIGTLAVSGQIPTDELEHFEFVLELSLSGDIRTVHGILPTGVSAARWQQRKRLVPIANATEAALGLQDGIFPAAHLLDVCRHVVGDEQLLLHRSMPME